MKSRPVVRYKIAFRALHVVLISSMLSCGGKNDPAPAAANADQQAVKAKLTSGTWRMQNVTVDGIDQTSVFNGFTIKFTESGFTTTDGGAAWPVSGSWSFSSADATVFKRDDGLEVTVDVTDTTLTLTLTWTKTTLSGGRTTSLKGKNVFSFVK
jgi:hypothetical protein